MVENRLLWVEGITEKEYLEYLNSEHLGNLRNLEHNYQDLYSKYWIKGKKYLLIDKGMDKLILPLTKLFMKLMTRENSYSEFDVKKISILWSARQMALENQYNKFKESTEPQVRSPVSPLNAKNLVRTAEKYFGKGEKVKLEKRILLTH